MSPDYGILHFSTIIPGPAFRRLVRRIESGGVQVVYDLEDTHWDPDDRPHTLSRKAAARRHLQQLAAARRLDGAPPLTVRINAMGTPESDDDLRLLADLSRSEPLGCVVLPKVDDPAMLARFLERTRREAIACREVIPLVETRRAVDGLGDLLAGIRRLPGGAPVHRIMYGMFDHCLDSGLWPFWDADSSLLWDLLSGLVAQIEAYGFDYVHTPIAAIGDGDRLRAHISRLQTICTRRFYVSTLVESQLQAARRGGLDPSNGLRVQDRAPGQAEKRDWALSVVEAYQGRRARGRELGFIIAGRLGHFVSPHEYVAARRYLEAHPDDHA